MKKLLGITLVSALLAGGVRPAWAWNETGHMLVADIALRHLKPAVRRRVERLLSVRQNPVSQRDTTDQDDSPVTAATYMDDIRPTLSRLHYIDQYCDVKGNLTGRPPDSPNAVTEMQACLATLRHPANSQAARAEALRYVMHLVGDLHQPLHCVSRVTPELPGGDRGGNDVPLSGTRNLHYFWDEGGGSFAYVARPLTRAGQARLDHLADQIEHANPPDARSHDLEVRHWLREGRTLAFQVVYADIGPGQAPSEAYRLRTRRVSQSRVALAGYRLANLLNALLAEPPAP